MIPIVIALLAAAAQQAPEETGPAPRIETPARTTAPARQNAPDAKTLAALIDALSSPEARRRDLAGAALMEMGPECYAPLREAFLATRIFEVRRRIRQIALELYLSEHLGPPKAFLGISHRGISVTETSDPRVPPWGTALYVTDVFKASSAQRAGLQSGDLVIALNGKAGTHEHQAIEFTRWIGEQTPGTPCEVALIRGGKGVKLVQDVRGAFAPKNLAAAKARGVTHAEDKRVWPGTGAVLLTSVRGVPVETDVRDGDLVLALDDEPLPQQGAEARFQAWVAGAWTGKGTPKKVRVLQPAAPGRARAPEAKDAMLPSMQVLRGGEGIDLAVTLGRWPTYISEQSQGAPRAASPGERDKVIEAFGTWWREVFDPDGVFSERADLDPEWNLRPGRRQF